MTVVRCTCFSCPDNVITTWGVDVHDEAYPSTGVCSANEIQVNDVRHCLGQRYLTNIARDFRFTPDEIQQNKEKMP